MSLMKNAQQLLNMIFFRFQAQCRNMVIEAEMSELKARVSFDPVNLPYKCFSNVLALGHGRLD